MEIISFSTQPDELPFSIKFSLERMYQEFEVFAKNEEHPFSKSSKVVLEKANQFPELREGLEDMSQLDKYAEAIELITQPLFPDPLQTNEIKAIMVPFQYKAFRPTSRFSNILKNAGEGFKMSIAKFDEANFYLMACSFILAKYYQQPLNFARPIFVEIPDKKAGIVRNYRIMFNADFTEIIKTDAAPELTKEDFGELLLHGNNLELWKSKFPPNSYIFKGFGVMNLYDATLDVTISKIRSLFLRHDENVFNEFRENMQILFGIKELQVGFSVYNTNTQHVFGSFLHKPTQSLFIQKEDEGNYRDLFCGGVTDYCMKEMNTVAIPDMDTYAKNTDYNVFSKRLIDKGIKSMLLAPIKLVNGLVQLLEFASPHKNDLNSLNAAKLQDILPFVKIAAERFFEETENLMESTIQENYTTIHPAVKWRFTKAATNFNKQKREGVEMPILEDIVFENVYPLYGQSDIKGSSTARNNSIQADLDLQLSLVIDTFSKIMDIKPMPIYKKLVYRVKECLSKVQGGLKAGDEVSILEFLKREIYPVFNHLKTLGQDYQEPINAYMSQIDPELNVVYKKRKAYDDSVTILNEKLSAVLDKRQEEAQAMFPHYFQRYNTDGVEYNMYIGDSLIENNGFDIMYLHNLRLWQLETMWDIEQKAFKLEKKLPYPLQVASLILIHSNSLAIKFMMDNKQFDVDGAYNARYEIIKKRIDKSYIKGTNERLTQPHKLAIVYSQDKDAQEYLNYLTYLQSEGKFGKIELLEIEDLQGVSGLKAIRAEILYPQKKEKKAAPKMNGKEAALVKA